MIRKRIQQPPAGPGRPRKYGEDLKKFQTAVPESLMNKLKDMKEKLGVSFAELLLWLVEHVNWSVLELQAKIQKLEKQIQELLYQLEEKDKIIAQKDKIVVRQNKLIEELHGKIERVLQQNEKLRVENQALREENKELKQRIRELERQLKLPAKDRKAIELKQEIHAILENYEELKLIDLLQKLGYEGDYKKHAKTFLNRWFVQQGYSFVSEELGLVIKPVHGFGELAWKVRRRG